MFVQVIEGGVRDRAGAREVLDRWQRELAPTAPGWLGATAGVADDGQLVLAARFADREQAMRNSARPEQGAWWDELVKHFDAAPAVYDCSTVALWGEGGSDDAGFVQVIAADVVDGERLRAALAGLEQAPPPAERPDVIGGLFLVPDDDRRAFEIVYFTTEDEARRGEAAMQTEPADDPIWSPIVAALGPPTYIDLREPWLTSP
jgi:hypothetical protein